MSDVLGRWIRRRLPALAVMLLLALLLPRPDPPYASAEPAEEGIELRWELGFRSVYKEGEYARLRLTLTNRTGRDLRGDVVFAYTADGYPKEIAVPAELPADTPIVVEMTVPGFPYNKDNNEIRFHEGGAGSGRQVGILGNRPYLQSAGVQSTTVGIVARDPDTLNFLPLLNPRGYDIRTIPIREDDLPSDTLQLEALDVLVLNDVPTGGWPRERIDAIRGWIIRGGKLIVAGGAGYAKTADAFADLVPVAPGGTAALESVRMLEAFGGEPLGAGTPVTVSTGELRAGVVTLADGVPLSAVRAYGAGKVLYVAFDPSAEPFASWGGSSRLWERILNGAGLQPSMVRMYFGVGYDYWNYETILNHFPSMKPPKIGHLSLFFIVYALLAAPVLYLVLRRFDRREWMWWLIPALSVVCSVVIFAVGSADKREVKAHSVRTVQLAGDGWADRSAAAAVFVPSGGKLRVSFGGAGYAVPLRDGDFVRGGLAGQSGGKLARMTDGLAEAEWRNVPYWSVRKAWVHLGASPGYGQFDTKFGYDGGMLVMEIVNNTAADLTRVHVLMNGTAYAVGDLKRGESGTVRIPYGAGSGAALGFGAYGDRIFPYRGTGDPYKRERGLLDAYISHSGQQGVIGMNGAAPMIVGFGSDGDGWFDVNGSAVPSDNVTLWVQPFDPALAGVGGAPDIATPVIVEHNLNGYGYSHGDRRLQMSDGTLVFEYPLPWREEPYRAFTVRQPDPVATGNASLSVWNEAAGDWEPVPMNAASYRLPEPVESYMTDHHAVRMRLEVTGSIHYRLPDLELEGGTAE